ncbi:nicotinate-nucleotide adenylyltransferase [Allosediminivita pacifica]|uniref:Probable nicotinate-nucleotide adenylyltransferase n=1 Tax=Allosediminivita pacifica TaxID=1267769 RepID=A0A2T6AZM2_9RHOB|nr:nicotinate-nucleotide adenylyltransferase [Allosediminivita pacifica]PTX49262.1 nicotinate-nucleotide adenylyltransferase [Allosediminivita pacifica]GGB05432.1 putative nicotinate-nucleotide adenylyltransferase [Allosediminivita pacifica]
MPALTRFEELPLAAGQAVGLLGGSFDPPHEGHLHISHEALRRFGLDRLVWLVSPGNPLKPDAPAPMERRMARARELVDHPRIDVSDFEARHGTRFTAETLERLRQVHRGVRFVWIMGADNLVQFHRWDNWQGILRSVPVGVLARPGQRLAARSSVAARAWRDARLPEHASHLLPLCQAPAWCFVNVPMREVSSTEIRARGGWPVPGGTQA